eukprot:6176178-Pleurochrysis_carterae.AAC.1
MRASRICVDDLNDPIPHLFSLSIRNDFLRYVESIEERAGNKRTTKRHGQEEADSGGTKAAMHAGKANKLKAESMLAGSSAEGQGPVKYRALSQNEYVSRTFC